MKNSGTSSASKTNRLKKDLALNNSISLSSFDNLNLKSPKIDMNTDLEMRMRKLETIVALLTNQNEILIKRVDELESNNNNEKLKLNRSYSNANFNNTTRYSNAESSASKENYFIKEREDINEWKRDIESSIEKISEKVANNNSNVLVNVLEKRVNELQQEFGNLKKDIEENLDQANLIRKNFERYEKSEKIINELITQISSVKTSNIKWQSDFLKNMNEYSEKLMNVEIQMDQLDKQDKVIHKKMDAMQIDLKRKETNIMENFESSNQLFEIKLAEYYKKFNELEEKCRAFLENNNFFMKSYKDEMFKVDNNIKALWDSFALFTTSK